MSDNEEMNIVRQAIEIANQAEMMSMEDLEILKAELLNESSSSSSSSDSNSDNDTSSDDDDDRDYDCDILEDKKQRKAFKFRGRRMIEEAAKMNNRVFKRIFRMSRQTFNALFAAIGPYLPVGRSPNKKNILPEERLLIFLRFVALFIFILLLVLFS